MSENYNMSELHGQQPKPAVPASARKYLAYIMTIGGLGGLLYGIDVGVIAGAYPYLEQTTQLKPAQLSSVVAAVLFGSAISSLFAGAIADIIGRKKLMLLSALLFILSIPIICLSGGDNYAMLFGGRILQGISGGLIGVVVPLYLAECLSKDARGKGTGMFQFLLTIGLVVAALIGLYYGLHIQGLEDTNATADALVGEKRNAWQMIFWLSGTPGIVFLIGALFISESPRWLYRKGRIDEARAALVRSSGEQQADVILAEMHQIADEEKEAKLKAAETKEASSIFQRKYIIPFVLAVVILGCNQATGINSVLAYSVKIFQQGGLRGAFGNYGDVILKVVNCVMTVLAVALVDRKGRKFLLKMGTSGIIVGLVCAAFLFKGIEDKRTDITTDIAKLWDGKTELKVNFNDPAQLQTLGLEKLDSEDNQFILTYKMGKEDGVNTLVNFSKHPLAADALKSELAKRVLEIKAVKDEKTGQLEPIKILSAEIGERPNTTTGWLVAGCFILFIAAFASGPGVCVWLALSELMPNRIRANGMSIALLVNQGVSTLIAWTFIPIVGDFGYSTMFFFWAGCTVIYLLTVTFFLPETKGKTLEEIEEHFAGHDKQAKEA